jgi:hypothetical protein
MARRARSVLAVGMDRRTNSVDPWPWLPLVSLERGTNCTRKSPPGPSCTSGVRAVVRLEQGVPRPHMGVAMLPKCDSSC